MTLYQELKRRNVIRVATAYVVAAWLIIQVFETIFPAFGFTDKAIRIVVIVLGIGFIPAVIGAWVFEWTPEGLRRDEPARSAGTTSGARILDRAIVVILLLGISYFAFDKFVLAPERAAVREAEVAEGARQEAVKGFYGDRSIAVVPFDNMSSDPEQEYFVDGIAEEVLNLLARIRELRVISRSSAFAFRGQNLEAHEIAERLDVAHILEGSVRKAGNRVRVTAQLIEARTDTHLWSKTYERELHDVFQIQDEIAADVAKNLQITLLQPLPRSRYVDPEVVALTQQARLIFETRPEGTGKKMHALLSRALEIDPDYVPALQWMSYAEFFRVNGGLISAEEAQSRYDWIGQRVRELDPHNAWIDSSDAWTLANEGRLEEAAELYLQALSKDMSNSEAVRLAGGFARGIGKFETSARLLRHSVAIDPLCFTCLYQLARTYTYSGDYERSQSVRERYLAIGSGGSYFFGLTLLLQGRAQEALDFLSSWPDRDDGIIAGTAMAWHSLGQPANAAAELEKLASFESRSVSIFMAETAAWMGRNDVAFEWLSKESGDLNWGERLFNPVFRSLHDDPRWEAVLEAAGLSPARLDAIEFDPELPE